MMNAYRFGQLTAQPAKFQKMAANSALKRLVADKFTKAAMGEAGEGGASFLPEGAAEEAFAPNKADILGEGGKVVRQEPDQTAALRELMGQEKELKGGPVTQAVRKGEEAVGSAGSYVKNKGQGLLSSLKGVSSDIGTRYLGGEAGKGLMKSPHTRTIAALLALLGAGAGGAYALSGGGDKKE